MSPVTTAPPIPRDYLQTADGLYFAVVDWGLQGEPHACLLRYIANGDGLTKLDCEEATDLLRTRYPHYLYHCPYRDALLHTVAIDGSVVIHRPREGLRRILATGKRDDLQIKLVRLVERLTARGMRSSELGISGSLLIGAHTRDSDIDVVIYGREAFARARRIVAQAEVHGVLGVLDHAMWQVSYRRRSCELSFEDYVWHEKRKHNKGVIDGSKFDLDMVPENPPPVDPVRYRKIGLTHFRARVVDDRQAFDYPAGYLLDDAQTPELLSLSSTYVGQAIAGELVEVAGVVELSDTGKRRVVVGSSRKATGEYIKVVQPSIG